MSRYRIEHGAFFYVTEDGQTFAIAEDADAAEKIAAALNAREARILRPEGDALAAALARAERAEAASAKTRREVESLRRYNEEINAALQGPVLRGLAGSHVSMIEAMKVRIAEQEAALQKKQDRLLELTVTRQPDGSWRAVADKGPSADAPSSPAAIAAALRQVADTLDPPAPKG